MTSRPKLTASERWAIHYVTRTYQAVPVTRLRFAWGQRYGECTFVVFDGQAAKHGPVAALNLKPGLVLDLTTHRLFQAALPRFQTSRN